MDQKALEIRDGFQINWMRLSDTRTNDIFWQGTEDFSCPETLHEAHISKNILKCETVLREMSFCTKKRLEYFHLEQNVLFKKRCLEQWKFEFGPVEAETINAWESVIQSAPEAQMLPPNILSGNIVIETKFYDGDVLISTSKLRVFYI